MTTREYGVKPPGYRLPEETRLGAVSLLVSDLARSIGYYEQTLGMQVLARRDGFAALGPRDARNVIVELHATPGVRPAAPMATLGLYHFAIVLPDRPSLGRFVKHVAAIGVRAGMADHLVSEAIYLTDPDGLGIEVYADRPRSTWQVNGRELAMTTEPLDAADLAAAAGGAAWLGMPAGTVLGHVHLHVGSLDAAAAFYHAALGFDKVVWSYPGALFMSAGGYHHHLGTNTWSRGLVPSADQARLLTWDIVLPSRDHAADAAKSLVSAGLRVEEAGGAWTAADPWGTTLRLVWPKL